MSRNVFCVATPLCSAAREAQPHADGFASAHLAQSCVVSQVCAGHAAPNNNDLRLHCDGHCVSGRTFAVKPGSSDMSTAQACEQTDEIF